MADAVLRATLVATWPASSDAPLTPIERNRSTIPLAMSWQTLTAVSAEAARLQWDSYRRHPWLAQATA